MGVTRWEWRDSGSASGHLQRVAGNSTFVTVRTAYRTWLEHATGSGCADCAHVEGRCPVAAELWQAYRDAHT